MACSKGAEVEITHGHRGAAGRERLTLCLHHAALTADGARFLSVEQDLGTRRLADADDERR
jgi:hypothetical protein